MRALLICFASACGHDAVPATPPPPPPIPPPVAIDAAPATTRTWIRTGLPKGPFATFRREDNISCGLRRDGSIACFDEHGPLKGVAPSGTFTKLDMYTDGMGCAIRESGRIACFGHTADSELLGTFPKPPAFAVRDLVSYAGLLCWIDARGAIGCKTNDNSALAAVPTPQGDFVQLACSFSQCCALSRTGELQCFGEPGKTSTPPGGTFTEIAGFQDEMCGLTSAGDILSWYVDSPTKTGHFYPIKGPFLQVTFEYGNICGLRSDGTGSCSQSGCGGQPQPLPGCEDATFELDGKFAYFSGSCGVDLAGELACVSPRKFD